MKRGNLKVDCRQVVPRLLDNSNLALTVRVSMATIIPLGIPSPLAKHCVALCVCTTCLGLHMRTQQRSEIQIKPQPHGFPHQDRIIATMGATAPDNDRDCNILQTNVSKSTLCGGEAASQGGGGMPRERSRRLPSTLDLAGPWSLSPPPTPHAARCITTKRSTTRRKRSTEEE